MEKLAGDLLLGLKFVKLEILSTSFTGFLYDKLGELRLVSLGLEGLIHMLHRQKMQPILYECRNVLA